MGIEQFFAALGQAPKAGTIAGDAATSAGYTPGLTAGGASQTPFDGPGYNQQTGPGSANVGFGTPPPPAAPAQPQTMPGWAQDLYRTGQVGGDPFANNGQYGSQQYWNGAGWTPTDLGMNQQADYARALAGSRQQWQNPYVDFLGRLLPGIPEGTYNITSPGTYALPGWNGNAMDFLGQLAGPGNTPNFLQMLAQGRPLTAPGNLDASMMQLGQFGGGTPSPQSFGNMSPSEAGFFQSFMESILGIPLEDILYASLQPYQGLGSARRARRQWGQ